MTKRLNGKAEQYPRDPYDWYREPPSAVDPLFDAIDFRDSLIYDPACGRGNILDVAKRRGFMTLGSDIIDRSPRHPFRRGNFLQMTKPPVVHDRPLSVVCNPPYNYVEGIGQRFIEKTIAFMPFYRAAFLMPIEFITGQTRHAELYSKHLPSHIGILSQRPTMPPGAQVEAMGEAAYSGGMADYVWIVWTADGPHRTEAIFLPPSKNSAPPTDKLTIGKRRNPRTTASSRTAKG